MVLCTPGTVQVRNCTTYLHICNFSVTLSLSLSLSLSLLNLFHPLPLDHVLQPTLLNIQHDIVQHLRRNDHVTGGVSKRCHQFFRRGQDIVFREITQWHHRQQHVAGVFRSMVHRIVGHDRGPIFFGDRHARVWIGFKPGVVQHIVT